MQYTLSELLEATKITSRQGLYKIKGKFGITRVSRGLYSMTAENFELLKKYYNAKVEAQKISRKNVII